MALNPLFTGKLVRLTAPHPSDADIMASWTENDEFLRLMDTSPARPLSSEGVLEQMNQESGPNLYLFRLRTLTDNRLIGSTDLDINWANQTGWLAIGIGDSAYWGKGYGSDALHLIVRYGFDELGLHRITLNVISYNTRAIRTYEKYGFVYEGRQRECVYREGQRFDLVYYGLLRSEYVKRQAP